MAKKWSEVANSPEFMALAPEQKEAARSQYFDQVVAPQVPPAQLQAARQQFDADTRITDLPSVKADISAVSGLTREQRQAKIAQADEALDYENRLAALNTQNEIGRALSIGGRSMLSGLASIPDIIFSPASALIEATTGKKVDTIGETVDKLADYVGAARPETTAEKISSAVTSGITGAASGVGLGNTIRSAAAPVLAPIFGATGGAAVRSGMAPARSVAERVGEVLASNPGLQISAGAVSGGSSSGAKAAGAGEAAQVAAGLAGGIAGGAAPSAIRNPIGFGRLFSGATTAAERRAAVEIAKAQAEGRTEEAARLLQDSGLSRLQYTPSSTPGVNRTFGEGTLDPGVMALENRLRNQFPEIFTPVDRANNAARMQSLEKIAGNDKSRDIVESVRSTMASRAKNEAMKAGSVDVSRTISAIDNAINESEGRTAIQSALKHVRGLLINEFDQPEKRIHVLENVRKEIGDMLEGKFSGDSNKALAGSRELIAVRDALNSEIGEQVPAFSEYLNIYRRLSRPINRMDIGRELMNRAGNATDASTGYRQLTADKFGKAFNDLDAVAARATGFKKAKADKILSKVDMDRLRALNDDFSRIYTRDTTVPKGSQTAGLLARGVGNLASAAVEAVPVVGPKIRGLAKLADETLANETKEKLAYLMVNPDEMRRVLAALPPKDAETLRKAASQVAYSTSIANNSGGQ